MARSFITSSKRYENFESLRLDNRSRYRDKTKSNFNVSSIIFFFFFKVPFHVTFFFTREKVTEFTVC